MGGLLFSFGYFIFRITLVCMHLVCVKAFPRQEIFFLSIFSAQFTIRLLIISLLELQSCWTKMDTAPFSHNPQPYSATACCILKQWHWYCIYFFIIQSFLPLGICT